MPLVDQDSWEQLVTEVSQDSQVGLVPLVLLEDLGLADQLDPVEK